VVSVWVFWANTDFDRYRGTIVVPTLLFAAACLSLVGLGVAIGEWVAYRRPSCCALLAISVCIGSVFLFGVGCFAWLFGMRAAG